MKIIIKFKRYGQFWSILVAGVLFLSSCTNKEEGTLLPLPTQICLTTVHHTIPIPETVIYVKFNTDEYPGLAQPDTFFDTILTTGSDGRLCWKPVPLGKHWLVAKGLDETGSFALPVLGALQVELTSARLVIDTILYVTE
jgi:hypothetical protein